jgi:creatinine amidohydrolase
MHPMEHRWEHMLPHQYRAAFDALPVVFLPLGTVEWHGEHNALGLDSLKAHALCVRAAELAEGGIVHPPIYGGMGGLDKPATVILEPELSWENTVLRPWLERLCSEFHRLGFRGIVMLTGHYGHNQQIVVRETAVRMSERLQTPVLGTPEYFLAQDAGYLGDHAGVGETSLLMHLRPELVEMAREDGEFGAAHASAQIGQTYADVICNRLAVFARTMPKFSQSQLDQFINAERALVSVQTRLWRTDSAWSGWRRMNALGEHGYGKALSELDFAAIARIASRIASVDA